MLLTWKQRLAVVAGNAMEFYDIAVFAAIAPFLTQIMENHGYENATTLIWGCLLYAFYYALLVAISLETSQTTTAKKCINND